MLKRLTYITPELYWDLPLSEFITVVHGDGNTGKSYIFQKLEEQARAGKLNVVLIDERNPSVIETLKHRLDCLFVIDNYDEVWGMRPDVVDILAKTTNQVLIFGRDFLNFPYDKRFDFVARRCGRNVIFEPGF